MDTYPTGFSLHYDDVLPIELLDVSVNPSISLSTGAINCLSGTDALNHIRTVLYGLEEFVEVGSGPGAVSNIAETTTILENLDASEFEDDLGRLNLYLLLLDKGFSNHDFLCLFDTNRQAVLDLLNCPAYGDSEPCDYRINARALKELSDGEVTEGVSTHKFVIDRSAPLFTTTTFKNNDHIRPGHLFDFDIIIPNEPNGLTGMVFFNGTEYPTHSILRNESPFDLSNKIKKKILLRVKKQKWNTYPEFIPENRTAM